jgi:hypothetical protein
MAILFRRAVDLDGDPDPDKLLRFGRRLVSGEALAIRRLAMIRRPPTRAANASTRTDEPGGSAAGASAGRRSDGGPRARSDTEVAAQRPLPATRPSAGDDAVATARADGPSVGRGDSSLRRRASGDAAWPDKPAFLPAWWPAGLRADFNPRTAAPRSSPAPPARWGDTPDGLLPEPHRELLVALLERLLANPTMPDRKAADAAGLLQSLDRNQLASWRLPPDPSLPSLDEEIAMFREAWDSAVAADRVMPGQEWWAPAGSTSIGEIASVPSADAGDPDRATRGRELPEANPDDMRMSPPPEATPRSVRSANQPLPQASGEEARPTPMANRASRPVETPATARGEPSEPGVANTIPVDAKRHLRETREVPFKGRLENLEGPHFPERGGSLRFRGPPVPEPSAGIGIGVRPRVWKRIARPRYGP